MISFWKAIRCRVMVGVGLLLLAGCPMMDPPPEPTGPDEPTEPTETVSTFDGAVEVEPNDALTAPMALSFDENGEARVAAEIARAETVIDIDFFALGTVHAGDRIIIQVETPDSDLDPVMAVTDVDGFLFHYDDDQDVSAGKLDPSMDEIVRDAEAEYFIAIAPAGQTLLTGGSYQLTVRIERGGPAPQPQKQTILLDFNGGRDTLPSGEEVAYPPLNPSFIDPIYHGQDQAIKDAITATVRQNFARFEVEILTTDTDEPPADRAFSTVLFGGSDPGGFGIALRGIDVYNKDPSDRAIIFTNSFKPDRFTSPPSPEQLGVAIGNVASHEVGHLLGLQHASNSRDLMNPYDAPDTLLGDQRFRSSFLGQALSLVFFFLPTDQAIIQQDSAYLLEQIVGRAPRTPTLDFVLGQGPNDLAIADLNQDGLDDIAVPHALSDTLVVLLNSGDGTFTPAPDVPADFGPFTIAAGDMNADGHRDLAIGAIGSVQVFLNDGAASFTSLASTPVAGFPLDIALGDLDGDGDLDAVTANFAIGEGADEFGNVTVFLNDGTGALGGPMMLAPGTLPQDVVTVDLDEDGDDDIVMERLSSTQDIDDNGGLVILLNNGDATFAAPVRVVAGDIPIDLVVDDVNGDDRQDLILANQFSEDVSVLLGNGDATFADATNWVAGDGTFAVTTADLDGDGDVDIAAANADSDHVSLLFNAGDGTFAAEVFVGVHDHPDSIASGDLAGDGDIDIVLAHYDLNVVSILFNKGDGTFGGATAQASRRMEVTSFALAPRSKRLNDIGQQPVSYCLTCQQARRQR